jgi:multidrug resistance efflux pump
VKDFAVHPNRQIVASRPAAIHHRIYTIAAHMIPNPSSQPISESTAQSQPSDSFSITAALDDAVAQLQAAAGISSPKSADGSPTRQHFAVDPAIAGQSPVDAKATLDLVEAMCGANDRREALEKIVRATAPPGTSSTVRAGLGGNQLKSLLDSRLGWIGSGSSLFDQVAGSWSGRSTRNTDQIDPNTKIQIITLPSPTGSARCQLWIHDDPAAVRWIEPVASTLGSVLFSRPARRIPILSAGTGNSAATKAWVAGAVLMVVLIAFWPVRYRVSARAGVETLSGRYIAMPFNARLLQVMVKPGQQVTAGQSLLQLDGRPLRLELETLETELQQAVKEHNSALASRRIADSQQATLEQKKLRRKIDLVTDRLNRLSVTSPIDGVVVSGDLKRHIGSPLELGQMLMEVAAMDSVAIELEIAEHEIGYVSKGMETRIKIDAIGGKSMDLTLQDVYPAAELRDDQNVFIGRIEVPNADGTLRPGMQGKAVAYGPLRPWIWSWVRGIVERTLWMIGY